MYQHLSRISSLLMTENHVREEINTRFNMDKDEPKNLYLPFDTMIGGFSDIYITNVA